MDQEGTNEVSVYLGLASTLLDYLVHYSHDEHAEKMGMEAFKYLEKSIAIISNLEDYLEEKRISNITEEEIDEKLARIKENNK